MDRNNLFRYATSELSQDAFICWLMGFAHKDHIQEDAVLRECAQELLSKIVVVETKEELIVTKITRQYKDIDVLVEVNDKYNIIIEDKTFTSQHGEQIKRYSKILSDEGRNKENIICVYYKIVEQCRPEKDVINLNRKDIIALFSKYAPRTNNAIFLDYFNYLTHLDNEIERFRTEPIENWKKNNDHPYKGFFTHLITDQIINLDRDYNWSYVANKSGGVRALWWYFLKDHELNASNLEKKYVDDVYLQIEDDIITVKMSGETSYAQDVRWKLFQYIQQMVPEFKKKTFRPGKWMTIGYIPYNEKNYKEKIQLMENVLQSIANGKFKYVPHDMMQ